MLWNTSKTLEQLRLQQAKGDGRCSQRMYWPGGGYTSCKEYSVYKTSYCQAHQGNGRMEGVFERLPPPPEPIFKVQENVDPSGSDQWSDGRFRTKRGQYAEGRKELKMTEAAIRNRRYKRKYRAKKRKDKQLKQRLEAEALAKAYAEEVLSKRRPQ